ncbi:MAG: protein-disulfide reductase DsbD domain-containing protein [Dongiaceae bacterium]
MRLITGTDSLAGSSTIEAGLEFRFAPGWHGYWRTPGDTGIAPRIDWAGSQNIDRETVTWPSPTRFVIDGLQNSIYDDQVILPATLTLKTAGDPARIRVKVDYAACSNICVPYQAELALPLSSGPGGSSAEAPAIAAARTKVPGPPAVAGIEVVSMRLVTSGSDRRLVVDLRSVTEPFMRPDLFVEGAESGIPAPPRVELWNDAHAARLTVRLSHQLSSKTSLKLTLTDGHRAAEFIVTSGELTRSDG